MFWWMWLIAGAALVVVLYVLVVLALNWMDDRTWAKRREIMTDRSNAEANMQQVIEKTITRMFEATRGYYR